MIHAAAVRLARPVFGLFTVWCLGCASFDSLIQQLFVGTGATQSCMTANDSSRPSSGTVAIVKAPADQRAQDGCGCTQCVGVEPAPPTPALSPQPIPESFAELLGGPLTDDREPLVPPPQISAIG